MSDENPTNSLDVADVKTEREFRNMLNLDCAIVYLLVTWSGPERVSRGVVFEALREIGKEGTPVFRIDCSDNQTTYVEQWLIEQTENPYELYSSGYGETLLLKNGQLIDFIKYPAKLGYEKTKEKLLNWKKYCH